MRYMSVKVSDSVSKIQQNVSVPRAWCLKIAMCVGEGKEGWRRRDSPVRMLRM